jgi:simple sugar transport system permease protein
VKFIPTQIYLIVPYIVTVVVLIMVSIRQRREDQPPAALGLPYFREER